MVTKKAIDKPSNWHFNSIVKTINAYQKGNRKKEKQAGCFNKAQTKKPEKS